MGAESLFARFCLRTVGGRGNKQEYEDIQPPENNLLCLYCLADEHGGVTPKSQCMIIFM